MATTAVAGRLGHNMILRGLYRTLVALLLFAAYIYTVEGAVQITATVQGQACVDTAVARGWLTVTPRRAK